MPESNSSLVAQAAVALGAPHEARLLVAHVLGCEPSRLLLAPPATGAQREALADLVRRRGAGEPLQHLTGTAAFRTIEVAVGPGVFVPRPETEVMVGWALDRLAELAHAGVNDPVVVELCAGSGAITAALNEEAAGGRFHCVEISADAHAYLLRNLEGRGVDIRLQDMADAFGDLDGQVDLVIANPPYVPLEHWQDLPGDVRDHDPAIALVSGVDGLDAMTVVASVARRLLRPGRWVCAEHAEVQERSAPEVFVRGGGFDHVSDQVDLLGRPRFVTARRDGRMVT